MKFKIYGDYGYESEQLLDEFDLKSEAIQFVKGYTLHDFGGYDVIEVASFASDGEYLSHWKLAKDED